MRKPHSFEVTAVPASGALDVRWGFGQTCGHTSGLSLAAPLGVTLNRSRDRRQKSIEPFFGKGVAFARRLLGIGSIGASLLEQR